ncbi:MAG: hypothetical protein A2V88_12350 [Elusimicrobia bacterium RBG_16_66_12]|nr:MAG: hypothetical protein A2V88_12350 [Elusimicrobia bacterium RBG_16_66_12]
MTMPTLEAITILPMEAPLMDGGDESMTSASLTGQTMALATPWKLRTSIRPSQLSGIVKSTASTAYMKLPTRMILFLPILSDRFPNGVARIALASMKDEKSMPTWIPTSVSPPAR